MCVLGGGQSITCFRFALVPIRAKRMTGTYVNVELSIMQFSPGTQNKIPYGIRDEISQAFDANRRDGDVLAADRSKTSA